MKSIVLAVAAAVVLTAAGAASAGEPEDSLKASGCLGCHDMKTKKVGPAFADVAKKAPAKGAARDEYEAKLVDKVANGKGHMKPKVGKDEVAKLIHEIVETKS